MAQVNHTPIQLYHSTTAAAVPLPANMVTAELALNAADGKLYYKDSLGGVTLLTDKNFVGSVTNVSVVSANGLAGTVATSTSTPAITLTTSVTGMVKANGTAFSAAVAGTDFAAPTSGTSILYGNGAGGFSNVTIGAGISFVGGALSSSGSGGTITSMSVVTANGFAGTVANSTTTPAITLTTSVTGILKGNGTTMSAAVAGTDYAPATTGTAILKGNNAGGFANAVAATDYAPATSGASILSGNSAGGFSNVTINPSLTFSGGVLSVSPATSGTSILKGNNTGGFANATANVDYATPNQNTTGSAGSLATTNWTVFQSGTKLFFAYNGVNKASIDENGNIITVGNVTAFGTP